MQLLKTTRGRLFRKSNITRAGCFFCLHGLVSVGSSFVTAIYMYLRGAAVGLCVAYVAIAVTVFIRQARHV